MSIKGSKPLSSKDQSNFRDAIKLYEANQYRKAHKITEQILKKNPGHGETTALRGLMRYHLNQKEEGVADLKKALSTDPESYICWHLYGIYTKIEKNYEEAVKAFTKTFKLEPNNASVCRDLAMLQAQNRQFAGAVVSRGKILEGKPGFRQNWSALAVAQFLNNEYSASENTLTNFEKAINTKLPKTDLENTEMVLFKNVVIYESGDVARALEHLESIADDVNDPLSVMKYRAKYLLELGRNKEAEKEYRALIKRNPENREYLFKLEEALSINPENTKLRKILYERLAQKYPKSVVIKSVPLEFLTGSDFKASVTNYLTSFFKRGVPSTFVSLKSFYKDQSKLKIIDEVVTELYKKISNNPIEDNSLLWLTFYLAQHYDYLKKSDVALEYIAKCFELSPEKFIVEFSLVKAKILKHAGDLVGASSVLEKARASDTADRFVNSKTGKYLLRANKIEEAIKTLSLFTKNDANGSGVRDMHDMQSLYCLIELAEAHKRVGDYGPSLKSFEGIYNVFREIFTDQFDFHSYSLLKGTARAYVDIVKFSNSVYDLPTYHRATKGATDIYITIKKDNDKRKADEIAAEKALEQLSEEERKRALKKIKKDKIKELKKEAEEREKIAQAAKAIKEEPNVPKPVIDLDPHGKQLLDTEDPLAEAFRYWKPLSEQGQTSLITWNIGYEIYSHQHKYVLALQAVSPKGKTSGASDAWVAQRVARLKNAVQHPGVAVVPPAIKMIVERTLPNAYPGFEAVDDLVKFVKEKVLSTTSDSVFEYITSILEINPEDAKILVENAIFNNLLASEDIEPIIALQGLQILKTLNSEKVNEFRQKVVAQWPLATIF
ncbi:hypothetical protein D0Z03_002538 [Geotrichum reessii]|nr:hypothetical protein D0Z03_002538 [Galactomyces reessii]